MSLILPSDVIALIENSFAHLGIVKRACAGNRKPIQLNHTTIPLLRTILRASESVPPELLRIHSAMALELLAAQEDLRSRLESAESDGNTAPLYPKEPLRPMKWLDEGHNDRDNRFAFEVILDVMKSCSDEPLPEDTSTLAFVTDEKFRDRLRLDMAASDLALRNAEFKAATVLAGSVIEALLLWALLERNEHEKEDREELERSSLGNLMERAKQPAGNKSLITPDTAAAIELAKNFRNLIHPGRAQRVGAECNRGTAHTAIGAVHLVVEDLGRFFS